MLANDSAGSAKNITPNREASTSRTGWLKRIDGGVRESEIDRQVLRRALPRPLQHRTGYVDAEHMARWRDLSRERNRRGAAAAADIDDALARPQLRPIDHEVSDRLEHNVLRRLPLRPALSGGTVPVGDLVGVLFVAFGGVHSRGPSSSCRDVETRVRKFPSHVIPAHQYVHHLGDVIARRRRRSHRKRNRQRLAVHVRRVRRNAELISSAYYLRQF